LPANIIVIIEFGLSILMILIMQLLGKKN
jgi:hypothetical protein